MNSIDILIVEDEAIPAIEIERALIQMGFNVVGMATNYESAIYIAKNKHPNLILLDIHLNHSKSGIEVAKTIKKIDGGISIIYLTGNSDESTIQKAIETNPIAYLSKPFKREDLKSTILLSIYKMSHKHTIITNLQKLGCDYYYDIKNRNLFFKGRPIKLSPKEKSLLEVLIDAQGDIVPFSICENHIWKGNRISGSALRTIIYRLHSKLEYKLIETTPSFGYRLIYL